MPTSKFGNYVRGTFPSLDFLPIAFITAQQGKNVYTVLNLAQNLFKQASTRVGTPEINRGLQKALAEQAPPMRQNRRPKIHYGTQVASNPPTIVLFTNGPELFDNTYERFLLKSFREHLPFADVPIKLYLRRRRRGDQPAAVKDETKEQASARRTGVDISKLKFRSTVSDEELKKESNKFDSELWKDL
jgi:GTP-binding protein